MEAKGRNGYFKVNTVQVWLMKGNSVHKDFRAEGIPDELHVEFFSKRSLKNSPSKIQGTKEEMIAFAEALLLALKSDFTDKACLEVPLTPGKEISPPDPKDLVPLEYAPVYQIYAYNKGVMNHCGTHAIQGTPNVEACWKIEREWMKWREEHIAGRKDDFPLKHCVVPSDTYIVHPVGHEDEQQTFMLE